jgi:acyl-CoA synthetase (AMP-forming)/AMP-acid ligase II
MFKGLMYNTPLTITSIMRHAQLNFAAQEVVSVTGEDPLQRCTYGDIFDRAGQLANALAKLGLKPGDRVATLAWNDYRHLEIYYATACSGLICHTINPRLFAEQQAYIINHAEDQWLFLDPMFVPLVEQIQSKLKTVRGYVVLTANTALETVLPNAVSYDELIAGEPTEYDWPELDEDTACSLCYTSGTTGNPKGVLYSHRATVLHAMGIVAPDVLCLSARDAVLPVVPMFHVNAWGIPYAAPMVGAKLVMPGPQLGNPEVLHALITGESVTISAGVPTVWMALAEYMDETGELLPSLKKLIAGGAAMPLALINQYRDRYQIHVDHAWGMTEMSPVGTYNAPTTQTEQLPDDAQEAIKAKQGRALYGVEMKIVGDDGAELPRDGKAFGALKVRGPWICSSYFELPGSEAHDDEGWFDTGDVATIDEHGFMQITDRTKDVIKSGGEWISSIELENVAVGHPAVAEAAVIGIEHPKWLERPLLVIVSKQDVAITEAELLDWYADKVAKWWIPDAVEFIDELPHTATGKLNKLKLREIMADYRFAEE